MLPRQDQLPYYQVVYRDMPDEVKSLSKGSYLDQAYFLYLHAMDLSYAFMIRMQDTFKGKSLKFSGSMNRNIQKIAT